MSQINVSNLTFSYSSHHENIFEDTSFNIDTDWKLGLISRNGRGKTTFLNLLLGKYEYRGKINAVVTFDYFPFHVTDRNLITKDVMKEIIGPYLSLESEMNTYLQKGDEASMIQYARLLDMYNEIDGFIIDELLEKEVNKLNLTVEALNRPYNILSNGEQTKVLIAALFMKKDNFLLLDEPTNHLDIEARGVIGDYLNTKKGFILVSHDRMLLDKCVDHILSINKATINVEKGCYSSWLVNKTYKDQYEINYNEKLKKEVKQLTTSAARTAGWSGDVEASKIGGGVYDRGRVGHKSAKMMKRSKAIEQRKDNALGEKKKLLKDIEEVESLSLNKMKPNSKVLVSLESVSAIYDKHTVNQPVTFEVKQGERIGLIGENGSGKSSLIKLILGEDIKHKGKVSMANGLTINYISQDTSHLYGDLEAYIQAEGVDETLFKTILRKLDFSKEQFDKEIQSYSGGQKKKVLLATSLCRPAHLFIWDEPLNYIDILSRNQVESVILEYEPTLIFVEHDQAFMERIVTKPVKILSYNYQSEKGN